jgi:DNA-binding response OmpR family regulator
MGAEGGGKLVLVADDDADVRELVVFRLERAGLEVITAADGEEALAIALERRPAVCVIDVMMPKLDGYEVTERLRAVAGPEEIRILLLTASVEEAAVERGFEAGADDYIKKPFSPAELADRVAASLENA